MGLVDPEFFYITSNLKQECGMKRGFFCIELLSHVQTDDLNLIGYSENIIRERRNRFFKQHSFSLFG